MAAAPPQPVHEHQRLFQGSGFAVADYRCAAPVEREGGEEPNASHSIVFVRRGVFQRRWRSEALLADPGSILFFTKGEPYRYAHPLPGGDRCTVLALSPALAREAVARRAPADAERRQGPFRHGHGLATARSAALQYELLALVSASPAPLAVEDLLTELADESLAAAYRLRGHGPARERATAAARRRHEELAEAARLLLNARLASPPSLAELCGRLGCSPFHLSRTFRRVVGVPLRRHLAALRARAAAERLLGGAGDLTELALELGYADHAHFTNAFRREWGVPPSRFRERVRGRSTYPRRPPV